MMMRGWSVAAVFFLCAPGLAQLRPVQLKGDGPIRTESHWDELRNGPLPRWREVRPPDDPNEPLHPYSISAPVSPLAATPNGLISSPPEYSPTRGVIFRYSSSAWPTVTRDCVVALTQPGYDEIAYVIVSSTAQQTSAVSSFTAGGADMSRVQFIIAPQDSIWARDYGPHFIWQNGALALADSHYYPARPLDNFVPTQLADQAFGMPAYAMDLYYSGGNFQPGPNRSGYITTLINTDNPNFSPELIAERYQKYQGIDTLHIFPRLPSSVDATGHIDMWMYLIDDNSVFISQFIPGSNATAISVTNNAATYMQGLGFTVTRGPALNAVHPDYPFAASHFTYANAFRVNNRIFIPSYGAGGGSYPTYDAQALTAWQTAAPGVQIVPINCWPIISAAGAIHCIVMQVPRYTDELPSAQLISPSGGELLVAGQTKRISWVATDNEQIDSVELYYSLNDGADWTLITTTSNSGGYNWTVPNVSSSNVRVKVAVTDNEANTIENVSANKLTIRPGQRTLYSFATGAGVDRFARGSSTASWANINASRLPVATVLSAANYTRISTSNATGTASDTNRYISSAPGSSSESTHVFEFTIAEDPARIADIQVDWEGFAGNCTNVELYVWDETQGAWSDTTGLFGENRSADNFAGNRDAVLSVNIREDFSRYLTADGRLTVLAYADRPSYASYHDYVAVTVSVVTQPGDMNCDGFTNNFDIDAFVLALLDPAGYAAAYPGCNPAAGDLNGDGLLNNFDIDPFVQCILSGDCN
ncbi:MAG: agmatine deiminase family protein [Planctomycetia bacterium]|nr:MAG: agmatine deiminase family protein [Planctomycetia bacterium]